MRQTEMQEIVRIVQERFRDLAISDPSELAAVAANDQDHQAKSVVESVLCSLPVEAAGRVRNEYFGAGPLEGLLKDEDVTEIIVNGPSSIWFEKAGKLSQLDDTFLSELTYRNFIMRVSRETGVQASLDCPFADGQWNEFRLHLITPPLARAGSVLTLRRHPTNPWRLSELERREWATPHAMTCLKQMIARRMNFLIIGSTGSGKTSVLNACLQALHPNERAVLIEDTIELTVPNFVSTRLVTRKDTQKILRDVDQSELLKQSLRMRPDRLVMGEIRGNEAKDLLMAFATGHSGCLGTMHAESARQALLRLEMLIQLGAAQWNLQAVRTLILLSLQAIVVVQRTPEGLRRLEGIYKIGSLEEVGFLLEKIV